MDVKAYLKSYRRQLAIARSAEAELDAARAVGVASPRLDGMPRSTGGAAGLDEQMVWIDLLERRLYRDREKALQMAERIDSMLDGMDPLHAWVISLRYLQGRSWVQIAMELDYSESGVYKLHGRALEEMRQKYGEIRG